MRILLATLFILVHLTSCAQSRRARNYLRDAQENARNRNFEEAFRDVQSALNSSPEYGEAWLFKADMHIALGENEEALESYRSAYEYSEMTAVLFRWGRASLLNGLYAEADSVLTLYVNSEEANPRYVNDASLMRDDARWAMEQMNNPVPFNPYRMSDGVNRMDMQYFPSITADGLTMVFTARNLQDYEDFYLTEYDSSGWSEARPLPGGLNTPGNEGAQSLSADGNTIYYAGCDRPDGRGSCDIYVSHKLENGMWSIGENLGPVINSKSWESQPSISADGKTLYFVKAVNARNKNSDIFYSQKVDGEWTTPVKLQGEVNTPLGESSPFVHFDNQTLYFASNGHRGMGGSDLYVARRQEDGTWGQVKNLGYPINTYLEEFAMTVAPDGRTAYYASDRDNPGYRDLYSFELPNDARATPIAWIKGTVVDDETGRPIPANVRFVQLSTQETALEEKLNAEGVFSLSLPAEQSYALNVEQPGYLIYSQNFALENQTEATAEYLEIRLKKLSVGEVVALDNVFYETDSYILDGSSATELNQLVLFLDNNPTVTLSVDGHTDNQGSSEYNERLSLQRAQSVVDYLIEHGIESSRLKANGYGALRPDASNETEEGRAQNRRTEITITSF